MQVLVDTNVVLRLAEPHHPQYAQAWVATRALIQRNHELCLVPQVHYEFWVVATRPTQQNGLGWSLIQVEAEIHKLGPPVFRFLRDERAIYSPWLDLVRSYSVQGKNSHDARLVAAMLRHNITHLLTFNVGDFRRFREITVIDALATPAI
jgi:predicted nucleic acid-binding protein